MDIPSIIDHNYYIIKATKTNKVWICEAERFDDKDRKLYYYYSTYELGSDEHKNNCYLSNSDYDILPSENDEVRLATMEEIDILMDILEKNGIVITLQEAKNKAKAPDLKGEDYSNKRFGYKIPDGYEFDTINNGKIILKPIKPKYPDTYGKCCGIIGFYSNTLKWNNTFCINKDTHPYIKHLDNLIESFCKLLICRDAYWRVAGEKMGLGKPWEPNEASINAQYGIRPLLFPSKEIYNIFYDNFKDLIEQCKELL